MKTNAHEPRIRQLTSHAGLAGALLLVAAQSTMAQNDSAGLHLQSGTIDTSVSRNGLDQFVGSPEPLVIQLDGPMTPARRSRLLASGIRIGQYLPTNAFIVRLDNAEPPALAGLDFVRWVAPYESSWKLSPEIGVRLLTDAHRATLRQDGFAELVITLFSDVEPNDANASILALPDSIIHVNQTLGGNPVLHITARLADVQAIAEIPAVQWIEPAPDVTLRNDTNRWIVQTNIAGDTPFYDQGLRGENEIVGVVDLKLDVNHCSFFDTEPIGPTHRKILSYNTRQGSSSHGTHVSGTIAGDSGDLTARRGVAYAARIVFADIPSFNEPAIVNTLGLHHTQGARIHTNSWGDDGTTAYNSLARGFDVFAYDNEDSLTLLAVTNTSTLRNPENAKNLLAVGASQDAPNQHQHCSGGTGPTSDGRRKPEIYAPGCSTVSARNSTQCNTRSLTGTSMACPAVAGAGVLVRQYYAEGFYPGGVRTGQGFEPTGALVKATLLNSAADMTGVPGYPSSREGWGRVLLDNAVHFAGDLRMMQIDDVRNAAGLSTGESVTQSIEVTDASEPLRITLVFTDPPASAGAALAPVNDLDLVVIGPGGVEYKGNVFAGGFSAAGGSNDAINNVEQVHIASPSMGKWTIRIDASAVNVGLQGYSLVSTGAIVEAGCYADCDQSTGAGVLDIFDFLCFQSAFVNGDPYGCECDTSTGATVCDVFDFLCFQSAFTSGCP